MAVWELALMLLAVTYMVVNAVYLVIMVKMIAKMNGLWAKSFKFMEKMIDAAEKEMDDDIQFQKKIRSDVIYVGSFLFRENNKSYYERNRQLNWQSDRVKSVGYGFESRADSLFLFAKITSHIMREMDSLSVKALE